VHLESIATIARAAVICAGTLAATAAHSAPNRLTAAAPLLVRNATATLSGSSITCTSGTSGSYSTPLLLRFPTGSVSSALKSPSAALSLNTQEVVAASFDGGKCDEAPFSALLSSTSIPATVRQEIREEISRDARGECHRTLRETLTVEAGSYRFEGNAAFTVAPLAQSVCK